MKKILLFLVLAISGLCLSSCSKDDDFEANLKEGQEFLEKNLKEEGVKATRTGLQYKILKEGNVDGKRPTAYSTVRCHYEGSLINGTIFDSSYKRGEPSEFALNRVIPGWTEGVQLMTEGSKFRFYLPHYLAYGPSGTSGIPPFSTLIFDVELIAIK